MILETIEAEGLAHLSYLIGDDVAGVCAVIDPRRDIDAYLELAHRYQVAMTHVLETHVHADFVSGARELAAATGASVCVSAGGEYGFPRQTLDDGEVVEIGAIRLQVLRTPGHTPEHVCFLVSGGKGASEPWALFTGDTLFAGDVGRPDLLGEGTEQLLARQLYRTLHERMLPLGDELQVLPAHGQGSPCGGNIGARRSTTIGYERRHGPRLQARSEDEFVHAVLASLPPAPSYYRRLKALNAAGPPVLGSLAYVRPLDALQVQKQAAAGDMIVVDTREIEAFGGAHVPGVINLPLRDQFPIWAGWMLLPEQPILLVLSNPESLSHVQRHLVRVGLDNIAGYLRHGMNGWVEAGLPFARTPQMSVQELNARIARTADGLQLLDVRRDDEWETGHIPGARHVYTPHLTQHLASLDPRKPTAMYCGTGYRASIAASVLQRHGFQEVYTVLGSINAWKCAGYPLEGVAAGTR